MDSDGSVTRAELMLTTVSRYSQLQKVANAGKKEAEAAAHADGSIEVLLAGISGLNGGAKSTLECWTAEFARLSVKELDGFERLESCHDIFGMDPTDDSSPVSFSCSEGLKIFRQV